jgi:hypothetical protein
MRKLQLKNDQTEKSVWFDVKEPEGYLLEGLSN